MPISIVRFIPVALLISALVLDSARAAGVQQRTDSRGTAVGGAVVTDTQVVTVTNAVPGLNPTQAFQIRIAASDGSGPVAVTSLRDSVEPGAELIDVSHDGQWIAFASSADPIGANNDRSLELFVVAADGSSLDQLTDDAGPLAGEIRELAISGDGGTVVFVSTSDLIGSNPTRLPLPFRVDRDGIGLKQMSPTPVTPSFDPGVRSLTISTDGSRAVFASFDDIDGSNPTFLGTVYSAAGDGSSFDVWSVIEATAPRISGDGATVAFLSRSDPFGSNPGLSQQIFADGWTPGTPAQVTSLASDVKQFDLSGAAQGYAFISSSDDLGSNADGNDELFSQFGGTLIQETVTATGDCRDTRLSDGGTLAAVTCDGDDPQFGGGNPDLGDEVVAVQIGGGASRVSATRGVAARAIDLSLDASRLLIASDRDDPFDPTSAIGGGLFLAEDGQPPTLLATPGDRFGGQVATISGDGSRVAYVSDAVTPGNPDGSSELYVVAADGSGLRQLTSVPPGTEIIQPALDAAGNVISFTSTGDLTGANPSNGFQIFSMDTAGGNLQQLSDGGAFASLHPSLSLDGTHVAFLSDDRVELVEVSGPVTTVVATVVGAGTGGAIPPDLSHDARFVVYSDAGDPLGSNPEGNLELFRFDVDNGLLEQLTFAVEGENLSPVFSGDGQWIWFYSSSPWFEDDPERPFWLYRISAGTLALERIGGLGFGRSALFVGAFRVDRSGNIGVFEDLGDPTGVNRDRQSDAFVLDTSRDAVLQVDGRSATRISWSPEAGPLRYDVARGELAALAGYGSGGTSLGSLVCLENDSPDLDTRWSEDTDTPIPGAGFFYVVRGAAGLLASPGSYGRATTGGERVASGASGCSP